MTSERPDMYLEPGMSEPQLLEAFCSRNGYYYEHAMRLWQFASQLTVHTGHFVDIRGRTGYLTDALSIGAAERYTIIEPRAPFAAFLRAKYRERSNVTIVEEEVVPALEHLAGEIDLALCCEQSSFLRPNYPEVAAALAAKMTAGSVFGMTMGPSHHPFRNYRIADHRSGVVREGEVMSELSHPIHQRVQNLVLKIVRAEHGYYRTDVWPPAAKAFDPAEVQAANDQAGFDTLLIAEELMPVPGSQVPYYGLNGWTSFFRWSPLADLTVETKISILLRAVTAVVEDPEYDKLAEVEAFHPTAYYLAIKH